MVVKSAADLVAILREHKFLTPAQLAESEGLQDQFGEAAALAQELQGREWLTSFQVFHLLQNQALKLLFGPYVLQRRLGEGGMGRVFQARHQRLGRIVALKFIRPECLDRPAVLARFQREARAAAQLAHPNVVTLYDADLLEGTHFCAMEFIDGRDLADLIREYGQRLPIGASCEYIRQAALGLQHAHEHGLVHRDIKPGNLMVTRQGVVKILDLGLARGLSLAGDGSATAVTEDGAVVGTVDYMAPEQAKNAREVDARADLYSLGCTLYHLLTGQPPFTVGLGWEKLHQHQAEEAIPVEELRPEVPAEVAAVVQKLLAKRPEQRFQTAAEVATALGPFCQPGELAGLPPASNPSSLLLPVTTPDHNLIPTVASGSGPEEWTQLADRPAVAAKGLGRQAALLLLVLIVVGIAVWLMHHFASTPTLPQAWPKPPLGLEALSYLPPDSQAFAVVRPGKVPEGKRDQVQPLFTLLHQLGLFDFAPDTGVHGKEVDHEAFALFSDLLPLANLGESRGTLAVKLTRPLDQAQQQKLLQAIGAEPTPLRLARQGLPYQAVKPSPPRPNTTPKYAYLPNEHMLVLTSLESAELGHLPGLQGPPAPFPSSLEPLFVRMDQSFLFVCGTFAGNNRKLVENMKLTPVLMPPLIREQVNQAWKRAQAFSIWLGWEQEKIELGLGVQCHSATDATLLARNMNRGLFFGKLVINLASQNLPKNENLLPVFREWVENIQFSADHETLLIRGTFADQKLEKLLAALGP